MEGRLGADVTADGKKKIVDVYQKIFQFFQLKATAERRRGVGLG